MMPSSNEINKIVSIQVVQFSAFKKKSSQHFYDVTESTIKIKNINNNLLAILAGFQMIYNRESCCEDFNEVNICNIPKQFSNYLNEDTLSQFYKIIKSQIINISSLCSILNQYPIATFILNVYVKQQAIKLIESYYVQEANIELFGNETDLLNDYNIEARGPLLDLMVKSLGLRVTMKIVKSELNQKFVRKSSIMNEYEECYGVENSLMCIEMKHHEDEIHYSISDESNYLTPRANKSKVQHLIRKSHTRDTDLSRVTAESRSSHKDQITQREFPSESHGFQTETKKILPTPKNANLNKSISVGIMNPQNIESFNGGFINLNKIIAREPKKQEQSKISSCKCGKKFCICKR